MQPIFQHRNLLPCLIQECLYECNLRLNDLNGIAVTSRPGLVVTLKAGIMQAIGLARFTISFIFKIILLERI